MMMRIILISAAVAAAAAFPSEAIDEAKKLSQFTYGKYYAFDSQGQKSYGDNSANVFYPQHVPATAKGAVVIEFHGGGFVGGHASSDPDHPYGGTFPINSFLANGFVYVAVNYRLITTRYYYDENNKAMEEEFINVSSNGTLSLHPSIKMSESSPTRAGQEYVTKSAYDAARALEYVIANADKLGIDPHRISFMVNSAGTLPGSYLSFVYPRLRGDGYTPLALMGKSSQLNYPLSPALDTVIDLWTTELGDQKKVADVVDQPGCIEVFTDAFCSGRFYQSSPWLCSNNSQTASAQACSPENFPRLTLGELKAMNTWVEDTEQAKGIAKLWKISENIADAPAGFHLYIQNFHNDKDGRSWIHNPLYAHQYAKFAAAGNVNYVVYYADYGITGMPEDAAATYYGNPIDRYYKSNFGFDRLPEVRQLTRASDSEMVMFGCIASKMDCKISEERSAVSVFV